MNITLINKSVDKFVCDLIDVVGPGGTSLLATMISDTLIGQIAPGVVTALIAYKQKRLEQNTDRLLEELHQRQTKLEALLSSLDEGIIEKIKNEIFPLLFDYASEEKQQEKIKYIAMGFEYILENQILQQDQVLTHYDILQQLRISEIDVLLYIPEKKTKIILGAPSKELDKYVEFNEKFEGYEGQKKYIINKLERIGLLAVEQYIYTDNDQDYTLEDLRLTRYGKSFIEFFKINNNDI